MENEIGKRYGKLTVIEKLDRREHNNSVYLCKCDWGKENVASTSCLVNGDVISCGCRNKENKANISSVDKEFTDGTNSHAIKKNRKINKDNTYGLSFGFDRLRDDDWI